MRQVPAIIARWKAQGTTASRGSAVSTTSSWRPRTLRISAIEQRLRSLLGLCWPTAATSLVVPPGDPDVLISPIREMGSTRSCVKQSDHAIRRRTARFLRQRVVGKFRPGATAIYCPRPTYSSGGDNRTEGNQFICNARKTSSSDICVTWQISNHSLTSLAIVRRFRKVSLWRFKL